MIMIQNNQNKLKKFLLDSNDVVIKFVSNYIVWIFLLFICIVIIFPRLFVGSSKIGFLDNLKPNEIGDAIGGMTAPIIGLFSAFLVYIAFRAQIKANEKLEDFNKKQIQITEFQNLKLMLDYIHDIANNIKIRKQGSNEFENIGFENCEKRIYQLSTKINFILSVDIEKNIDIEQFLKLENYLNIFLNKVNKSELDDLDKDFLLFGINKFFLDRYRHFSFDEYIEKIESAEILKQNKTILLRRANYLHRIIKCLDNFHKY